MAAERETTDRLIAAHLADHVGATFPARIAGVTRSGLFVRLKDTGADGYIPISSLGRRLLSPRRGRTCTDRRADWYRVSAWRHGRGATARSNPLGGCAAVRDVDAAFARQRRIENPGGGGPATVKSAWQVRKAAAITPQRLAVALTAPLQSTQHDAMSEDLSRECPSRRRGGYRLVSCWPSGAAGGKLAAELRRWAALRQVSEGQRHLSKVQHGALPSSRRRRAAVLRDDDHGPRRGRRYSRP